MRLTLIIPSLGAGGAERVMTIIANYWAERGRPVTLLTLDSGEEAPFFALHPAVHHRPLGIAKASGGPLAAMLNNFGRIARLRRAIIASAPQAVISFMHPMNTLALLATAGLRLPVIVSERTDPRYCSAGRIWDTLRLRLYPRASALVVQSEAALRYFPAGVGRRSWIIPNPVQRPQPSTGSPRARCTTGAGERRRIVAMGRLTEQKGFDLLLSAFAEVAPRHLSWQLEIWGEGERRGDLERLCQRLGLDGRACLPGRTAHAHEALRRADLFVLSSRFEGFPNVLCEAMACGLPVISFDCPSGPSDIVRDGIDGVLVPPGDVAALAAAIDRLINDEPGRRQLAARADEVLERFALGTIMGRWERVLNAVAN